MKTERMNPRQIALEVCFQVLEKGLSLNDLLEKQVSVLEDRDKAFCSELCYGFCRYYFVLKEELSGHLKKPLKARDRDVQVILLLGLYQIRFMRVEDYAAVNESVKLLKKGRKIWAKGLVNAVLRAYIRSQPEVEAAQPSVLSMQEHARAYPLWMKHRIEQDWGDYSASIFAAGNQRAPMVIRVDLNRFSRADYLKRLQAESIDAREHPVVDSALILRAPVEVESLPGFATGQVSVQDASAQLAADLLHCEPGMRVLDACSAPGGKTLHLLQRTQNIEIIALDKDQVRLQRVAENTRRAGLEATLICADAAHTQPWFDGALFDRILLDVPCSASGIIRRHPDIRLLRKPGDIAGLVEQQKRLLFAMWALLKPGGRLLYSTCSLFKDENEHQVIQFIAAQDNCVELPLNKVEWGFARPVGRQILSGFSEMDGFYYAVLEKRT